MTGVQTCALPIFFWDKRNAAPRREEGSRETKDPASKVEETGRKKVTSSSAAKETAGLDLGRDLDPAGVAPEAFEVVKLA